MLGAAAPRRRRHVAGASGPVLWRRRVLLCSSGLERLATRLAGQGGGTTGNGGEGRE